MLLNCGVGEDSWESLGLQGDSTSPSKRKSVLDIHWKNWCWSWNSNTLATWLKNWLIRKDTDAGKVWRQEKRATEDEMVGWHHLLDGHKFEQSLGVGDDREAWHAVVHGVAKSQTGVSNWTELNYSLSTDLLKDILVLLVLVILNKAAINLHVQDFVWV